MLMLVRILLPTHIVHTLSSNQTNIVSFPLDRLNNVLHLICFMSRIICIGCWTTDSEEIATKLIFIETFCFCFCVWICQHLSVYILSIQSNICVYLCMPACLCVYRTHRISGSTWLTKHTAKFKSCFQNWHESWHGGFRYSFLSLFQNRFLMFSFLRPNCG